MPKVTCKGFLSFAVFVSDFFSGFFEGGGRVRPGFLTAYKGVVREQQEQDAPQGKVSQEPRATPRQVEGCDCTNKGPVP